MPAWVPFVIAVVLLGALVIAARRATTLLEVSAEDGRVVSARGRASGELLREISDVLERAHATGRVRLRLEDREVVVDSPDLSAAATQQIRNVVGRFPAARLKTAPRLRPR